MPVRLLAIDTTEEACSAALLTDGGIAERFELAPRRHSELILPMMEGLLRDAGLRLSDLDALAFARGPGSFTGVRIAAAVIQGVAFGVDLPVLPVSSLQALAQGAAREHAAAAVMSALDARMGEVYWGCYRADSGGLMRPVIDECVCAPRHVPMPEGADWYGVGSGWGRYAAELGARCAMHLPRDDEARVHAQDVATLAAALFAAGGAVSAGQALPVYLRDEVAWAKPA